MAILIDSSNANRIAMDPTQMMADKSPKRGLAVFRFLLLLQEFPQARAYQVSILL
jgi:hypothetical protein